MKELDIKLKLIDFLMNQGSKDIVIASEVRFDFGSRRADIVLLSNGYATTYEIKSAGDSVERLSYQVKSYKEYFDYCYIVCVEENISAVRKNINKNIGIIIVSENKTEVIRLAKLYVRHNKIMLASTIPNKDLMLLSNKNKIKSKFDLCKSIASNYTLNEIRQLSRQKLLERTKENFEVFKNELGKKITPDDILTISRMPSGNISRGS